MMSPYVMTGLGAGLLAAVLAGVTMGNAAVEGINPVHYAPPPTPRQRVVMAIEPSAANLTPRRPTYGELYGWEAGEMARIVACGDACARRDGYSATVPYFNSREELAEAERAARRAIDSAFAAESRAATSRKNRGQGESRMIGEYDEPALIEEVIAIGDSDYSE
jgi:hypothetical protein